jgi:phosphate transport system permease protein
MATFTGRARRRTTHPWVKAGDRIARVLITLGGIGTIVAVLLVGAFLLTVALPLFRGPAIDAGSTAPWADDSEPPAALGMDESGAVAWLAVRQAGVEGLSIQVISVADGTRLLERPAAAAGLASATAVRFLPGGLAAAGFADGSIRVGTVGLESSFLSAADLPAAAKGLRPGQAARDGDAVIVRSLGGQYARVVLRTELGEPTRGLDAAIIDIDVTRLGGGPLVAALDERGRIRVETVTTRRNLLTDALVTKATGATIEPEPGFAPRFLRVSELGDQLFLFAEDGAGRRIVVRDVESPQRMESFAVDVAGRRITVVERLFGGASFAVATADGGVRILCTSRAADAKASDGLAVVTTKRFDADAPEAAVTSIAGSPRSRLFAVADELGGVRLLQATTAEAVAEIRSVAGGQASAPGTLPATRARVCLSPRENRLLAVGGGRLAEWQLDVGFPDVSLRTLFQPVWYENYPGHVHAWETTGHEAFEAKYGLVPLIFGTIKATLYSMLFATPIAILAAIYASQFMHPVWKARIKPTIEMMASLPSVVLGFMAGIVFAPLIERAVMPLVAGILVVPLTLLAAAHVWQLLPSGTRARLAAFRLPLVGLVALPLGLILSRMAGPLLERLLFDGDFRGWLDGRGGSGFGGWVVALAPLSAVAAATAVGRGVNPWLRRVSGGWSPWQAAVASFGTFLLGVAFAAAIAAAGAMFCDALRWDTRGGLFGTYVQRNALVVAFGMSFAIIPLVFTIADDALSSVPDHLRSASLGAGATPWQTAVRVIVPAAASGLFSAVMIGLGRAVGETMIVLMAAGNTPLIGWNVFNGFQTLSAAIATELPEAARGGTHYRVLFLAALVLFAMTFVVNTAAEIVRQRFRRRAHEL